MFLKEFHSTILTLPFVAVRMMVILIFRFVAHAQFCEMECILDEAVSGFELGAELVEYIDF